MDDPRVPDIEAAVRAYLARLARRYAPLAAALVVLVLVATLMPTKSPTTASGLAASGSGQTGSGVQAAGGAPESSSLPSATSVSSVGGGGTTTASGPSLPVTYTPPAPPGSRGRARSGVECSPGAKQVTWSTYSVPCQPVYHGNNGGATAHGVTASEINISYRVGSSTQDAAISAAVGPANENDAQFLQDLRTYINFFNTQFELYGRKVVLRTFQAQGDYLAEDQGLDQAQAQADAQTAYSQANAFADITFPLKGSEPYWVALANAHVITFDPVGFPTHYYEDHAPWWYTILPTGTQVANWLVNLTCLRLNGLKAIFAGEQDYTTRNRTFGLVTPDNPEYTEIGNYIISNLKSRCGVEPKPYIRYTINVARYGDESASTAAQLKAAGVTTVICYCDPVFTIPLAQAADGQRYYPEWYEPFWEDPQAQQENQREWAHAFTSGGQWPDKQHNEAYKVYKLANPSGEPAEQYYALAYAYALVLFDVLQYAGPNLNPTTLQHAWFSMPAMNGQLGPLEWGPQRWSPTTGAPMAWWNPSATSQFDNRAGAWINCEGGKYFPLDLSNTAAWGPAHTQPHCFGK